jgi:hypothetical protein
MLIATNKVGRFVAAQRDGVPGREGPDWLVPAREARSRLLCDKPAW